MEMLIGFVYDVVGLKAIRREKNFAKKLRLIIAFPILGFLLVLLHLSSI